MYRKTVFKDILKKLGYYNLKRKNEIIQNDLAKILFEEKLDICVKRSRDAYIWSNF